MLGTSHAVTVSMRNESFMIHKRTNKVNAYGLLQKCRQREEGPEPRKINIATNNRIAAPSYSNRGLLLVSRSSTIGSYYNKEAYEYYAVQVARKRGRRTSTDEKQRCSRQFFGARRARHFS